MSYAMAQESARSVANADGATRLAFIRKVYLYFSATLLCAIGAVAVVVNSQELAIWTHQNRMFIWIGALVGCFGVYAVRKMPVINIVALLALGGLIGMMSAPIIYMVSLKDPSIVTNAFVMTCTVFGSLTAWVFISRKDYSWLGGMLFTAFWVLFAAGILFMFVAPGNTLYFVYLVAGTLIFSGYVLYDTSMIIHHLGEDEHVAGALALFLDFYNLFMFILQLLNSRD
jgi:modulator of FtsH protease